MNSKNSVLYSTQSSSATFATSSTIITSATYASSARQIRNCTSFNSSSRICLLDIYPIDDTISASESIASFIKICHTSSSNGSTPLLCIQFVPSGDGNKSTYKYIRPSTTALN